jgi:type I restriction enzyme, S subunit
VISWNVPSRFPQLPFRRLFERLERPVSPNAEIVTAYTDGRVTFRRNVRLDGYHEAADLSGFQGVEAGDFVVHGLDILRGSVGVSDSSGAISAVCAVTRPRPGTEPRYFAYAIRAQAASGFTRALARGVREGGADFRRWDTLGNLPLPVPPSEVQRAIADYLDTETARIDGLLATKRRMMDLLDERLAATVRMVVTKGSWDAIPLKRRWKLIDCKHRTPDYVDDGYPVVSPGDVTPGQLDLTRCHRFVSEGDFLELTSDGRRPKRGDIIYSRNASIGIASFVSSDTPFCMGQDVCLITSKDQDQRYLTYVLNTLGLDQLEELKIGSTFSRINVAQIADLVVPCPPPGEQSAIADELDEFGAHTAMLVASLRKQTDLLVERRESLITAAVTGMVELPEIAA